MEEELATRIEVVDKLRVQLKDVEKEKRDTLRRYNEQVRFELSTLMSATDRQISRRPRRLKQNARPFMITNSI